MTNLAGQPTFAPLFLLLFSSAFLVQWLRWYHLAPLEKIPGWMKTWEFTPRELGGTSYWQLLIASSACLFLELLMIRWISSEISIFAYFKNFVLIACFLGFGIGCYKAQRPISLLALFAPLSLVALVVSSAWSGMRQLILSLPTILGAGSDVYIWGVPNLSISAVPDLVVGLAICASLFLLIALVFLPVGQLVGWYLENASSGIRAYSVNLLGSILGIAFYTALCFWDTPPSVWFVASALLLTALLIRRPRMATLSVAVFALCAWLATPSLPAGTQVYWSPYQKLILKAGPTPSAPEFYDLLTNDSWFQRVVNLSPEFTREHPERFKDEPLEDNAYNVPYRFYPGPRRILILGSGMGNDVAAALRNTKAEVTAVEIDPLILRLGQALHFEHPYSSSRVHVVVNDARNYIQNTSERYDLIVFSLLDSHTTSSHYSNVRIDNYVYTIEALTAARRLLTKDGMFVVKFWTGTPWIAGRLEASLQTVFKDQPHHHFQAGTQTGSGTFFVVGGPIEIAMRDPSIAQFVRIHNNFPMEPAAPTTDDWPYFYQRTRGMPLNVILMSLLLVAVCAVLLRHAITNQHSERSGLIDWHFFMLGAAFMLMEAQIISKMALLFGTTWIVNSIVISAILLVIIAANFAVQYLHLSFSFAYTGIFLTLAMAALIPLRNLFFSNILLQALLATLLLCSPVFFAGVVFINSFSRSCFSARALGSNLFGALVGGLLESLSFWIGLRALLICAGLLYLLSAIALRRRGVPEKIDIAAEQVSA